PLGHSSIMELDRVLERLLMLGGSYVGLEFAQMFRRFGSQVTVIELGPRLMPREDPDVSNAVTDVMREDGLEILLQTTAQSARRIGGGIELRITGADGERLLSGTQLLVAAGRGPHTDRLPPRAAGLQADNRRAHRAHQ